TPSLTMQGGTNRARPAVDYECDLVLEGEETDFKPCGASPESEFTAPESLPNGDYMFYMRSRVGDVISNVNAQSFTITDWTPTYTASTSTQQAAAHPDLDLQIAS